MSSTQKTPVFQIKQFSFSYPGQPVQALDDVSLTVEQGGISGPLRPVRLRKIHAPAPAEARPRAPRKKEGRNLL